MIREADLIRIGQFQRTHALMGELNAILDIDIDYLEEGGALILPIEGVYVPFFAESVRPKGNTSVLIKLKGISTQEEASQLVNLPIYALREDVEEFFDVEGTLVSSKGMEGYRVKNSDGKDLGEVLRVDDATANILLLVKNADDEIIYIPFVENFILDVDHDEKILTVDVPEELLLLNSSSEKEGE